MEKSNNINESIRTSISNAYKYNGVMHMIEGNYFNNIVNSFEDKRKEDKFIYTAFSSILFLDTYKMVSDKVKKGIANELEMSDYNQLSQITNFDELKSYYEKDITRLMNGFAIVNELKSLPGLTKINIYKNLTREENARLNRVTPLHQNDIDKYNITVDKEYIYDFYTKYNKYLNKRFKDNTMRPVVTLISNFIKESFFINPDETKVLIGSITEDVFKNIETYSNAFEAPLNTLDALSKVYQEDENNYTNICLRDLDIMELTLGMYFDMKDNKVIKGKTYDKK